jgi:cystathionine beta-lyase/cystathionine gamma-synthase
VRSSICKDRLASGITGGWVRHSLGIEDVEDLIADLELALKAV